MKASRPISWRVIRWIRDDEKNPEIHYEYANEKEARYDFKRYQGFPRSAKVELQSATWETHEEALGPQEEDIDREPTPITRAELYRLTTCNSAAIPPTVNDNGVRRQWVGIGWVEHGKADGSEAAVITDPDTAEQTGG